MSETVKTAETPKSISNNKNSKKTIIVAVAAVAVIGAGFGAWRFIPRTQAPAEKGSTASKDIDGDEKPRHKSKKRPQVKSVMHLESFVVNLTGQDESGYLRVGIDLGCDVEESGGEGEKKKGDGSTAIIRDTVLTVLGRSKASDLLTPEGKEKLKKELVEALDERLPDLGILEVYFTEFIVQR
jgi:flagellar basal body-associated protein FliL